MWTVFVLFFYFVLFFVLGGGNDSNVQRVYYTMCVWMPRVPASHSSPIYPVTETDV